MATKPKVPAMLFGIGVAAIAALMAALLARKESREKVIAQESQSLDYLKEQGQKLRERGKEAGQKGRNLIGCQCHESVQSSAASERPAYEEEKRAGMGG